MDFKERFRGYLPVVIDLETGGFDNNTHPILELACTLLNWADDTLAVGETTSWSVAPYPGSTSDPASLKITGIDPTDPNRAAQEEKEVLKAFFGVVRGAMKAASCHRAILVAHNASFDQGFLKRAVARTGIKRDPFHPFSAFDTVPLCALAYGHTVLSESCRRAGLEFDNGKAHSAAYDAERTAALFCQVVNQWPLALPAKTEEETATS